MKKTLSLSFIFAFSVLVSNGQQNGQGPRKLAPAAAGDSTQGLKNQLLTLLLHKPVDKFENSHLAGFGAEYAWSKKRFGFDSRPGHPLGWMAKGGVDYFIGKKDPAVDYAFRYFNYLYLHVMGGAVYSPASRLNIMFNAGPGLGIYKNSSSIGINASAAANVFVSKHISVGPSLIYRKHKQASELWSASLRIGYVW